MSEKAPLERRYSEPPRKRGRPGAQQEKLRKDTKHSKVADRQLQAALGIEVTGIKHGNKSCSKTGEGSSCGKDPGTFLCLSSFHPIPTDLEMAAANESGPSALCSLQCQQGSFASEFHSETGGQLMSQAAGPPACCCILCLLVTSSCLPCPPRGLGFQSPSPLLAPPALRWGQPASILRSEIQGAQEPQSSLHFM